METAARTAFGRLAEVSTPVDNPLSALAELAGHVTAWMTFCGERVANLEQLAYEGITGEQIKGEIVLWERALDRCNTVLGTFARLNIDERLAAISERQAEAVLAAIDAALDAVAVPRSQRPDAKRAAARHLQAVN